MKNKRLLLMGLAFVTLVIVAFVVMEMPGERSAMPDEGNRLINVDSATVGKMEIVSPSYRVTLVKRGAEWRLEDPIADRADQASVASLIGEVASLRSRSVVSTNPGKRGLFQVDSTGTIVMVYGAEGLLGRLVIGKMGASFGETYVRPAESDEVHLVNASLTFISNRGVNGWRDKSIVQMPREEIRAVMYQYGDTTFTLEFQDSLWTVGGVPADDAQVSSLLMSLVNIQADDFLEPPPASKPVVTAVVRYAGHEISFSPGRSSDTYTVQRSEDQRWFEMRSWRVQQILKRETDLRAKQNQ